MAYTTIDKPTDYFRIKTYTGNATANTPITWDETNNMKPDWLWFKNRSQTQSHAIFDVLRGVTKRLSSNNTSAESTEVNNLDSFDTNGFTIDTEAIVNGSGNSMVAWGWKANGAGVSNTSGTISSTVSANTTAGFSIVSYTGNGTNGATIGHGLGVAPKMVIPKCRSDASTDWSCYHASLSASNNIFLNLTQAQSAIVDRDNGGISTTSSTIFTIAQGGSSQNNVNGSGRTYIAYCFAEVKGFSKFGSYTGNNANDGTFVYTGFKPAFILVKTTNTTQFWTLTDNKRNSFNMVTLGIAPNSDNSESTFNTDRGNPNMDFVSNGFKIRTDNSGINGTNSFIYMAFAENPFVSSKGIPTTAR